MKSALCWFYKVPMGNLYYESVGTHYIIIMYQGGCSKTITLGNKEVCHIESMYQFYIENTKPLKL